MNDFIIPARFYQGEYATMFKEDKQKWIQEVNKIRQLANKSKL